MPQPEPGPRARPAGAPRRRARSEPVGHAAWVPPNFAIQPIRQQGRSRRPSPSSNHSRHAPPLPDRQHVRIVTNYRKMAQINYRKGAPACIPSPSRQTGQTFRKDPPDERHALSPPASPFLGLGRRLRTPDAGRIGPHRDDGADAGRADHWIDPSPRSATSRCLRRASPHLQPWRPCSPDTPLDRLNHAMGKSYADLARMVAPGAPRA